MKTLLSSRWALIVLMAVSVAPVRADELPEAVQTYLNQHYAGWRLTPIQREAEVYFREREWRGEPAWTWGYLNEDSLLDYVLTVQVPLKNQWKETLLVLWGKPSTGFFETTLESRETDGVRRSMHLVRLIKKAETLLDYAGRPVMRTTDAIESVEFNKEAQAYIHTHNSQFRRIRTVLLE